MLRQSCANGTRTERAVQGRDPGSIPVRTAIDVASVGPMAGDVTQSKMPQLLGFASLSQSSLREQIEALSYEGSCRINAPRGCCLDRSF
jgi:hypothetical protein